MHMYERNEQGMDMWHRDESKYNTKKFNADLELLDFDFSEELQTNHDHLKLKKASTDQPENKDQDDQDDQDTNKHAPFRMLGVAADAAGLASEIGQVDNGDYLSLLDGNEDTQENQQKKRVSFDMPAALLDDS
jgi:hypothetical protein